MPLKEMLTFYNFIKIVSRNLEHHNNELIYFTFNDP